MSKRIICMMLMLMIVVAGCAFAEQAEQVPSVTISEVIMPEVIVPDAIVPEVIIPVNPDLPVESEVVLVVYVAPVVVETAPKAAKVFDKIVETVQVKEEPVAKFFKEEVIESAKVLLPEETVVENLTMDEFFVLEEEGYVSEYGDIEATFAFPTEYKDEDVLIAMIGILPTEEEIAAAQAAAEEAGEEFDETSLIVWVPVATEVVEGKVKVCLTEDLLTMLGEHEAVMALLREEAVSEELLTEEAE